MSFDPAADILPLRNETGFLSDSQFSYVQKKRNEIIAPQLELSLKLQDALNRDRAADLAYEKGMLELNETKKTLANREANDAKLNELIQTIPSITNDSSLTPAEQQVKLGTLFMSNTAAIGNSRHGELFLNMANALMQSKLQEQRRQQEQANIDRVYGSKQKQLLATNIPLNATPEQRLRYGEAFAEEGAPSDELVYGAMGQFATDERQYARSQAEKENYRADLRIQGADRQFDLQRQQFEQSTKNADANRALALSRMEKTIAVQRAEQMLEQEKSLREEVDTVHKLVESYQIGTDEYKARREAAVNAAAARGDKDFDAAAFDRQMKKEADAAYAELEGLELADGSTLEIKGDTPIAKRLSVLKQIRIANAKARAMISTEEKEKAEKLNKVLEALGN